MDSNPLLLGTHLGLLGPLPWNRFPGGWWGLLGGDVTALQGTREAEGRLGAWHRRGDM